MSTPTEKFEIAVDDSHDREAREGAIDELETANECDALAKIVRRDRLADRYRELALSGLAHPQCRSTLETLATGDELDDSLRERAETLLEETPEDAGPDH